MSHDSFSSARPEASRLAQRNALTVTQRFQASPDQRDRTLLVRIDSTNAGQVYALQGDVFSIGRHPDNTACIEDQGISRHHARVVKKEKVYWLEDLSSSNGTYVNGRRVTACELTNGDTVQFGPRVSFRLSVASEDEERVLTKLYESSVKDPLTQVFNRQYFAGQIASELSFAVRHQTDLSLLLVDIDHFKHVNDTYGHLAGDDVLKLVAKRLLLQLRTEDVLARYGGEEFVVLLRGINLIDAGRAGERLRAAVTASAADFHGVPIPVTISVGCASLKCCEDPSPDVLIQIADGRLYRAKNEGRNRVVSSG